MGDNEDNERKPLLSRPPRNADVPYEWGPGGASNESVATGVVPSESGVGEGNLASEAVERNAVTSGTAVEEEKAYSSLPSDAGEESCAADAGAPSKDVNSVCSVAMVTCRVCQKNIDITGRTEQHVVKCSNCQEATPIRNAPPGKKYVRCSCNCLLICKTSSQRIACPRPDCERVINLNSPSSPPPLTNVNLRSVECAHCANTFLFNPDRKALAKCPYCGKVSAVGSDFIRRRSTGYIIAAFICFIIGIGVTAGTYAHALIHGGIFVAYVGVFILGAIFLWRAIYYRTIKVSRMEEA